jgi:hypothetical protein
MTIRTRLIAVPALLVFPQLGSAAAAAPASACAAQEQEYRGMVQDLPTACDRDLDCALADIAWNPCVGAQPFPKDALDAGSLAALRAYRSELHKRCGFVMPPCAAVPEGKPYCFERRCDVALPAMDEGPIAGPRTPGGASEAELGESDSVFAVVLVDRKTRWVLRDKKLTLTAQDTIYCATAPCPQPEPRTIAGKSDDQGMVELRSRAIGGDNVLSVAGYSPRRFSHDQLKGLRGRKIAFDPAAEAGVKR